MRFGRHSYRNTGFGVGNNKLVSLRDFKNSMVVPILFSGRDFSPAAVVRRIRRRSVKTSPWRRRLRLLFSPLPPPPLLLSNYDC